MQVYSCLAVDGQHKLNEKVLLYNSFTVLFQNLPGLLLIFYIFQIYASMLLLYMNLNVSECIICAFAWPCLFFLFCFILFQFVFSCLFSNERERNKIVDLCGLEGREDLGGVEERETIFRLYCMKKNHFQLKYLKGFYSIKCLSCSLHMLYGLVSQKNRLLSNLYLLKRRKSAALLIVRDIGQVELTQQKKCQFYQKHLQI